MEKHDKLKKNNNNIKSNEINTQCLDATTKECEEEYLNQTTKKIKNDKSKPKKEKTTNNSKSKKRTIIILFVIILVFLLASGGIGAYYYTTENKKIFEISETQEATLQNFSEEVKYGQEFSYDNLLDKLVDTSKLQKNTKIIIQIDDKKLSKEETFKFEKLGTYTIKVKLEYTYTYSILNFLTKDIEKEKILKVVIRDKEKPVIKGVANKEITVGDNINLQDGITATDDVDGEVEVKIEGTVDNQKAGNYNIKVIAVDKSGNIEEATFTVTVKEKSQKETINKVNSGGNQTSGGSNSSTNKPASSENHIADILRLTNQYRSEVGANVLTLDSKLSAAAQKRAIELVSTPSHTRPDGTSCFTIFDEYEIFYWTAAENIAIGQANGVTAANWWRNSSGHYKNMTDSGYTKIGIGAYYSGGTWYWVQLFTS